MRFMRTVHRSLGLPAHCLYALSHISAFEILAPASWRQEHQGFTSFLQTNQVQGQPELMRPCLKNKMRM